MPPQTLTATQEIAAALDWWREAGVDQTFADDATEWLAEPEPSEAEVAKANRASKLKTKPAPPPPEKTDLFAGSHPADLATFREWWLTQASLDARTLSGRVPPRGEAGAHVMVLVADPEPGDTDTLLSGTQGKLLSAMLSAMGVAESEAYIASTLPLHTPLVDATALEQSGLGEVLRHHIALVAPRRILAFGGNILPLVTHDAAQGAHKDTGGLLQYVHQGASIPVLASEGLDALLAMPRLKARLWRRWLEWTSE